MIVGIDPGSHRIGYAAVEPGRSAPRLIRAETIEIPSGPTAGERLVRIADAVEKRLAADRPSAVILERLYFSKNVRTAFAVAEARGVILLTAARLVRSIGEYTPQEVKLAVTGDGRADKQQVRRMVELLFPGRALPRHDDGIDAIAIALAGCSLPGHSQSAADARFEQRSNRV